MGCSEWHTARKHKSLLKESQVEWTEVKDQIGNVSVNMVTTYDRGRLKRLFGKDNIRLQVIWA